MKTQEYQFKSDGTICVGTLMLPDDSERPPVIVMAHGFAAIRKARLPQYAERFVDAGYAVFLFDYRTFGDSEGEPRNWVHPGRQIEDWEAAIDYVKSRPEVDADKMVLWGTSFSGGHVLQLAAGHPELRAVISQVPHVSGPATTKQVHPGTILKTTLAAVADVAAGLVGRTWYSKIVGEPGECAAVTSDNADESYQAMLPADTVWENSVLSRSFLHVPLYSPRRHAKKIRVPVLIIGARDDTVVPASAAKRAARKISDCVFHLIEGDHFAPYFGQLFEECVRLQIDFLGEHVPGNEHH
jgi:dienelactone hydrolase